RSAPLLRSRSRTVRSFHSSGPTISAREAPASSAARRALPSLGTPYGVSAAMPRARSFATIWRATPASSAPAPPRPPPPRAPPPRRGRGQELLPREQLAQHHAAHAEAERRQLRPAERL